MKHVFIVNPAAGKGRLQRELVREIRRRLPSGSYELYETAGPGDGQVIAAARLEGSDGDSLRFYACGGDGTLFEVVNGVAGRAPVGNFPCGSGNDFIKNFQGADFMDLEAQLEGRELRTDLILCNGAYVTNVCNLGFDADIAAAAARYKNFPLVSGNAAYLLAFADRFFKKMSRPMKIWVDDEPEPICRELIFALLANGQFYGGSFRGAPRAEINDGWLDLCVCGAGSRLVFAGMASAFRKGLHVSDPRFRPYISYLRCKKVRILTERPTTLALDGNCQAVEQVEAELRPGALRFLLPAGGSFRFYGS
ncbi:MAG: diacylglycerol kinase family protein [Bacillota bacterium]|nr:diacylglycerol kinase family protein [Bacillota bacterium]